MTARVGSTALLQLISNNYGLPFIEELFNGRDVANVIAREHNIKTFRQYLGFLNRFIPNEAIFAFKTSWSDFEWCVNSDSVEKLFPDAKYVYLDRSDIDAQAVSLHCAVQSGKWHTIGNESGVSMDDVSFSKPEIDMHSWHIHNEKLRWHNFFAQRNIAPITIFYESIIASPKAAIATLLKGLELDGSPMETWDSGRIIRNDNARQIEILEEYRRQRYPGIYVGNPA